MDWIQVRDYIGRRRGSGVGGLGFNRHFTEEGISAMLRWGHIPRAYLGDLI